LPAVIGPFNGTAHADNPWIIAVSGGGPPWRERVVIDDCKDNYILLAREHLRIPASLAAVLPSAD
jgi:hypothetical protein